MKPSNYNFFFQYDDDKRIAFNSLTTSLALIDNASYQAFMSFCDTGEDIQDKDLVAALKIGAFIHDDYIEENEIIQFNMLRQRFSTTSFGLTIAPTSDCNFRCIYCYEKDVIESRYMSEEVQENIIHMLEDRVGTINNFSVTWYGGEPLMAFDIIKKLSESFINICNDNNITYSAGIITNGFLLNSNIVKQFKDLKITFIQVTIDGLPDTHNERRPLLNGDDTFNRIFENFENNYKDLPNISLRINIDKNNIDAGEHILNLLIEKNLIDKIKPYYGKISNDNGCYDTKKCLNTCEFFKIEFDYQCDIKDLGANKMLPKYPSYKANFCGADSISSYVVNANGDLYKCWSDMGNIERRVGNLLNKEENINNNTYFKYLLYNPTIEDKCRKCKVLPICMGGCPYRRINEENDNCSIYNYILDDCIKYAAKMLVNENSKIIKDVKHEA